MKRTTKNIIIKIFGESIVITGSVLFALYIDNWNQERLTKKTEIEYITRLIKELKADSLQLITSKTELIDNIETLDKILSNNKDNLNGALMAKRLNNILRIETIKLHSDTYEVLKYNGGFDKIQSHDIVFQIVNYYSETTFLDLSNLEVTRVFQQNMDMLKETGHIIADSTNSQEIFEFYQLKNSRGLLKLRKLYNEVFMTEVLRREESSNNLIKTLKNYLKEEQ